MNANVKTVLGINSFARRIQIKTTFVISLIVKNNNKIFIATLCVQRYAVGLFQVKSEQKVISY